MAAQPIYCSLLCLLISSSWSKADTLVALENNGPACLFVDVPVDKDGIVIKLADVLTIVLAVDGSKTRDVKPPDRITNSPGWRVAEVSPAAITELGENCLRWRQRFVLEPLLAGSLPLQIEPLLSGENGATFQKISWKPVSVRVTTDMASPDLKSLRDPTFIEPLTPAVEPDTAVWPWVVGSILLVFLLVLSWIWWRRRARPTPLPAEERALRELKRVLALRLPEQGKVARFHGLLANIVRRFVERKYQLPARRRTTREFLEVAGASDKLSVPSQDFLRAFLPQCDLAKFAGANAQAQECIDLAEKVRAFIESAGSNPSPSG
jgi:hypothetical protein